MHRKLCSIGNSQGISIPLDMLERLNLSVGSEVDVKLDEAESRIIIEPVMKKKYPRGIDREFVSQVNDFIGKYKPALKELAKK
ncbi:MAG: AbrB/MazE/SpoVT family DNA-binding domain-containing protein [Nitrospirota bacterium]